MLTLTFGKASYISSSCFVRTSLYLHTSNVVLNGLRAVLHIFILGLALGVSVSLVSTIMVSIPLLNPMPRMHGYGLEMHSKL